MHTSAESASGRSCVGLCLGMVALFARFTQHGASVNDSSTSASDASATSRTVTWFCHRRSTWRCFGPRNRAAWRPQFWSMTSVATCFFFSRREALEVALAASLAQCAAAPVDLRTAMPIKALRSVRGSGQAAPGSPRSARAGPLQRAGAAKACSRLP